MLIVTNNKMVNTTSIYRVIYLTFNFDKRQHMCTIRTMGMQIMQHITSSVLLKNEQTNNNNNKKAPFCLFVLHYYAEILKNSQTFSDPGKLHRIHFQTQNRG